jgi:hypothetical protein
MDTPYGPNPTLRASVEAIAQSLHEAFAEDFELGLVSFCLWIFRRPVQGPDLRGPQPDDLGAWASNVDDEDRDALLAAVTDWLDHGVPPRLGTVEDLAERRATAEALDDEFRRMLAPGTFYVLLFLVEPEAASLVEAISAATAPPTYLPGWYISSAAPEEREALVKPRLCEWVQRERALLEAVVPKGVLDVE